MKYESKFRKEQREARLAFARRGRVLWVSCYVNKYGYKVQVDGTFRRVSSIGTKSKAAKKAARKLTHKKNYYAERRCSALRN